MRPQPDQWRRRPPATTDDRRAAARARNPTGISMREHDFARRQQPVELIDIRTWRAMRKYLVFCSAARMDRPTSLVSCTRTAVGKSRGLVLIAYPNSVIWTSGIAIIVANVIRSRRSCRNSLTTIAPMRPPHRRHACAAALIGGGLPGPLLMSSMNTSSSDGVVLVSKSIADRRGSSRWRLRAQAASRPQTCRLVPNGATMSTPAASG